MKNLLGLLIVLFATNSFSQELNDFHQKRIDNQVTTMKKVMKLSHRQEKKIRKLQTAQERDVIRISSTHESGSFESIEAWKTHGENFSSRLKALVSDDQWSDWYAYNCELCNKQESEYKPYKVSQLIISKEASKEIDKVVAEMKVAMFLSAQQEEAVYNVKVHSYIKMSKIYKSTEENADRKAALKDLYAETDKKLKEATSLKQMTDWWRYWQTNYENPETAKHPLSNEMKELVDKTVAEMTQVMQLTPEQQKQVYSLKVKHALDSRTIANTTEDGSERSAFFHTLNKVFYAEIQDVTSPDQMKVWWKLNHKSGGDSEFALSNAVIENIEKTVREMEQVMHLTPQEKEMIYTMEIKRAMDSLKIYQTTNDDSERTVGLQAVNDVTYRNITNSTSPGRMDDWWTYWRENYENNQGSADTPSKVMKEKIEKVVSEMMLVMQLTPEQKEIVYDLKMKQALDSNKLYQSTPKGTELTSALQELNRITDNNIIAATSREQMHTWWKYWEDKSNNK